VTDNELAAEAAVLKLEAERKLGWLIAAQCNQSRCSSSVSELFGNYARSQIRFFKFLREQETAPADCAAFDQRIKRPEDR